MLIPIDASCECMFCLHHQREWFLQVNLMIWIWFIYLSVFPPVWDASSNISLGSIIWVRSINKTLQWRNLFPRNVTKSSCMNVTHDVFLNAFSIVNTCIKSWFRQLGRFDSKIKIRYMCGSCNLIKKSKTYCHTLQNKYKLWFFNC